MINGKYLAPDSFSEGRQYWWCQLSIDKKLIIRKVEFINYRPHPGEVVIRWAGKVRIVHRRHLYLERGTDQ